MDRQAALLQQIHEAFDGVGRDDGITLHEATAIDNYACASARQAARNLDKESRWQDVPDQHIAQNDSVFSFLDIKGHVYYAPAYMSWLIRTGYDTQSNSVESAQSAFNPWGKVEAGRRHKPHDMFSQRQCQAIAAYLLYVHEVLDQGAGCSTAKPFLDQYWDRYL